MTIINGSHKKYDFTLAKRLEQLMIERNLYPRDIERLTGVRRQRIYEYIQGVAQPSAFMLKRIATGLHVSSDWLLGLTDSPLNRTENLIE